jgi:hypothetical protein
VWSARLTDNGSRLPVVGSEPSRSIGHWYGWRDLQVVVLEAAARGNHAWGWQVHSTLLTATSGSRLPVVPNRQRMRWSQGPISSASN